MNARRSAATTLAVLAALTLTVSGPIAFEANVHSDHVQVARATSLHGDSAVVAAYKPGPPPVWCGIVRFCPYTVGV